VVDASLTKALKMGKGHDCWYNNSCVSTDLLMLPILKASPEECRFVEYSTETGVPLYHFPEKYADTLPLLLKNQKEKMESATRPEKEGQH